MRKSLPDILKRVGIHILFWLIVVLYFGWGFGYKVNFGISLLNAAFYLPGFMLLVYSLLYYLIPKFLIKRNYLQFFAGYLLVLCICAAYAYITDLKVKAIDDLKAISLMTGRAFLPFIHVSGIAISIKLLDYWYKQKQKTAEVQQEKLLTELELIKSQIHPHFLFNTLNNLYSYTLEQSDKAPEIVLKLSSLLRFMIYESNTNLIPLTKEISLIREYIDLEKLRYGNRIDISVSVTGVTESQYITPLLLLPLVENAFKHGTSMQIDQCWISLDISMAASVLQFKLINSIEPNAEKPEMPGGIGLKNLERRLALLYPEKYKLEFLNKEEVFVVNMDIDLSGNNFTSAEQTSLFETVKKRYEMEMPDR